MANGKHGDHPINDICDHGLAVFSENADAMIREIHQYLPRHRMWDLFNWLSPPPIKEFEEELKKKLAELRKGAKDRGWEVKT